MKLSSLHQEVVARINSDSRWTHRLVEVRDGGAVRRTDFVLVAAGYNGRTIKVLRELGLVETSLFQGPRGGRLVGIKLTVTGKAVAQRIGELAEGIAPLVDGNQDYNVNVGLLTFSLAS